MVDYPAVFDSRCDWLGNSPRHSSGSCPISTTGNGNMASWKPQRVTRPGKLSHHTTNWKITNFLMGKLTISTGPFSITNCKRFPKGSSMMFPVKWAISWRDFPLPTMELMTVASRTLCPLYLLRLPLNPHFSLLNHGRPQHKASWMMPCSRPTPHSCHPSIDKHRTFSGGTILRWHPQFSLMCLRGWFIQSLNILNLDSQASISPWSMGATCYPGEWSSAQIWLPKIHGMSPFDGEILINSPWNPMKYPHESIDFTQPQGVSRFHGFTEMPLETFQVLW